MSNVCPYDKSKMTCLFTKRDWEVWERIQARNKRMPVKWATRKRIMERNEKYLDLIYYDENLISYNKKKSERLKINYWTCVFCNCNSTLKYRLASHILKSHWGDVKTHCEEYDTSLV